MFNETSLGPSLEKNAGANMKVIVAGSREGVTYEHVEAAIKESQFEITEVVSGTAKGADQFGEAWAIFRKIPIKRFPADWNRHGKSAGYLRNKQMAEYGDALIAVHYKGSKGTQHMIDLAKKAGLLVYVLNIQ